MRLYRYAAAVTALVAMTSFSGYSHAESLSTQFATCVDKFANSKLSATVMLECTAAEGKLSNCKVLEAPTPINGFDKAAMCVANVLPVGAKTGTIKVPIHFQANS
jgi:hypothetical protein